MERAAEGRVGILGEDFGRQLWPINDTEDVFPILFSPPRRLPLRVSGIVASAVGSPLAALSQFQSQYFVVIAADCFLG